MNNMMVLPAVYPSVHESHPERLEFNATQTQARNAAANSNPQEQMQQMATAISALARGIEHSDQRNNNQLNRIESELARKRSWNA